MTTNCRYLKTVLFAVRGQVTMRGKILGLARLAILLLQSSLVLSRSAFEKLTDVDFAGTAYYTVRNLSLYECQGWCREEPDCQAAAFRYKIFHY
ncbi:hypothetical protein KGM_204484 [Danaus plexippus plexippus]|uniref:Uncharacterized protein n=1 Tax=Danaus plexippus plexippus TaxID=278856 RepID=A0A212FKU3_DANPL|nr:hypothetical protein KGM_204484 [Danaus plexippus plexippus]